MCKLTQWLCIVYVLILPAIILAQEWVALYNGPGSGDDWARKIAIDAASNIYVTGYSLGAGTDYDYATVKYDSYGTEQWVARYNGTGNGIDWGRNITVDCGGNVYVTGQSMGSVTDWDYATVMYDSSGVEQWVVRYDGPASLDDKSTAIAVDGTGNVYVTGISTGLTTYLDYATVKYDSSGVEQWVARYDGPGGGGDDLAYAIVVDTVGHVYVTGYSYGSGTGRDYATVMYDSSGVEQWAVRYNGPLNKDELTWAIAVDNVGNVYVTGLSIGLVIPPYEYFDIATVKYDSSGVEQWVARYDGPVNNDDRANAIAIDNAGNIYVTGESWGSGTCYDCVTLKYNSTGVEQWVARYDGPVSDDDHARALVLDNTCNVYVTGYSYGSGTGHDYVTIKYDSSGIEQWVMRYNGQADSTDVARAIVIDDADNVYVTGGSRGQGTDSDYATLKYSASGIEEAKFAVIKHNDITSVIFNGCLQLPAGRKCEVYDIMGRVVEPSKIQPGIYFIEVEGVVTQKVVKVR